MILLWKRFSVYHACLHDTFHFVPDCIYDCFSKCNTLCANLEWALTEKNELSLWDAWWDATGAEHPSLWSKLNTMYQLLFCFWPNLTSRLPVVSSGKAWGTPLLMHQGTLSFLFAATQSAQIIYAPTCTVDYLCSFSSDFKLGSIQKKQIPALCSSSTSGFQWQQSKFMPLGKGENARLLIAKSLLTQQPS